MEYLTEYGYWGLFLISFGAATILPISSELVFMAMIAGGFDPYLSLIVACWGNSMGGMTNYYLGRLGNIKWLEKYLKMSPEQVRKIEKQAKGKGAALAFFSFLPVVGDAIAFVLGVMRANLLIVSLSMFAGKLLRYAVLLYAVINGIEWLKNWS